MILAPLAMPPLFCAANFVTGRDYFKRMRLPGRSIWYVTPLLACAVACVSPPLWPLAFAWAAWRGVLGWSSFGGAMNPTTIAQAAGLAERNALMLPFTTLALWACGHVPLGLAVGMTLLFWVLAEMVSLAYGYWTDHFAGDVDPEVDALHGLLYGGMVLLAVGGLS